MTPVTLADIKPSDQAVLNVIAEAAINGKPCPTNKEICERAKIGLGSIGVRLRDLKRIGAIDVIDSFTFRRIEILVGEGAGSITAAETDSPEKRPAASSPGKSTGMSDHHHRIFEHYPIKPSYRPEDLIAKGTPKCSWCGDDLVNAQNSCCSHECAKAYIASGCGPTKAEVERRLQRLNEPRPKGCTSVEEWLAAGGAIYREPERDFTTMRRAA